MHSTDDTNPNPISRPLRRGFPDLPIGNRRIQLISRGLKSLSKARQQCPGNKTTILPVLGITAVRFSKISTSGPHYYCYNYSCLQFYAAGTITMRRIKHAMSPRRKSMTLHIPGGGGGKHCSDLLICCLFQSPASESWLLLPCDRVLLSSYSKHIPPPIDRC